MTLLFWVLVGFIVYGYVGYPAAVAVAGHVLDRGVRQRAILPRVSVIVAAYNEEANVRSRVCNILASSYPSERLELVIASDGSSDDTVGRVRAMGSPRVRILDLPRRGKAAALAEGAAHAGGEILVFSDANTEFRADAVAKLVRNFADDDVGGVVGHTGYVVPNGVESTSHGEDLYWRYDTWLKALESRTGSVVSAHGGMYAIRRELFRPVEDPAVTDDFAISTAVVVQGMRLVFEPEALGYEATMARGGSEFRRRVRLMTRGLRGVLLRRRLLNPFRYGFYSVALASRKVLRRLLPLTFPPLLAVSAVLASRGPLFATVALAQLALLVLATAGWLLRRTRAGRLPLLYAPLFFCLANLASALAVWNTLRGRRIERWSPHRHELVVDPVGGGPAPGV